MICKNCGSYLSNDAKVCDNCGLPQPDNNSLYQIEDSSSKKHLYDKKHFDLILGIVIIVIVIGIVVISIHSCNNNSSNKIIFSTEATTIETLTEEITTVESTTEEPTTVEPTTEEITTVKPTEPPTTEKPTEFIDTLSKLYSNDDVTIYYSNAELYKYSNDRTEVYFYVENKTNKQLTFQADTIILDGISYNNVIMSDPVSANSMGEICASVERCSNTSPSTVGGDLRYFSSFSDRVEISINSQNVK